MKGLLPIIIKGNKFSVTSAGIPIVPVPVPMDPTGRQGFGNGTTLGMMGIPAKRA